MTPIARPRTDYLLPLGLLLAYGGIHMAARLLASLNLAEVDPEIEVAAQQFALGYGHGEAPLYTWIILALERLIGPGVIAYQIVKYACVTVTGLGLFGLAWRMTGGDRLWSLLAVEALALIYQLSWRLHEGFSSELLALAVVPWLALLLLRLAEDRRWHDSVRFALAALVAMESTTPARLFLLALVGAGLLQSGTRRAILSPLVLPALVAVIVTSAHLLTVDPVLTTSEGTSQMPTLGRVAFVVAGGPLLFLLPHLLILVVLFPGLILETIRAGLRPATTATSGEHLLLHAALLGVLLLALGAATGRLTGYAAQWVGPLFLTVSTFATVMARRAAGRDWQVKALVGLGIVLATVAFGLRLANMYVQQPVCKICRWGVPYDRLAAALKADGIGVGMTGTWRITVFDIETAGNLVRFFPGVEIVAVGRNGEGLVKAKTPREAVLWPGSGPVPQGLNHTPNIDPRALPSPTVREIPWATTLVKPEGHARSTWSYIIVK